MSKKKTQEDFEELLTNVEPDEDIIDIDNEDEDMQPTPSEIIYENPISINKDNIIKCKFDVNKFQNGIDDFSYYAGAYIAMINAGLSNVNAINFVMATMNINMNKDLTKMNNAANIEVSKNQTTLLEKTQL